MNEHIVHALDILDQAPREALDPFKSRLFLIFGRIQFTPGSIHKNVLPSDEEQSSSHSLPPHGSDISAFAVREDAPPPEDFGDASVSGGLPPSDDIGDTSVSSQGEGVLPSDNVGESGASASGDESTSSSGKGSTSASGDESTSTSREGSISASREESTSASGDGEASPESDQDRIKTLLDSFKALSETVKLFTKNSPTQAISGAPSGEEDDPRVNDHVACRKHCAVSKQDMFRGLLGELSLATQFTNWELQQKGVGGRAATMRTFVSTHPTFRRHEKAQRAIQKGKRWMDIMTQCKSPGLAVFMTFSAHHAFRLRQREIPDLVKRLSKFSSILKLANTINDWFFSCQISYEHYASNILSCRASPTKRRIDPAPLPVGKRVCLARYGPPLDTAESPRRAGAQGNQTGIMNSGQGGDPSSDSGNAVQLILAQAPTDRTIQSYPCDPAAQPRTDLTEWAHNGGTIQSYLCDPAVQPCTDLTEWAHNGGTIQSYLCDPAVQPCTDVTEWAHNGGTIQSYPHNPPAAQSYLYNSAGQPQSYTAPNSAAFPHGDSINALPID